MRCCGKVEEQQGQGKRSSSSRAKWKDGRSEGDEWKTSREVREPKGQAGKEIGGMDRSDANVVVVVVLLVSGGLGWM